MASGEDGFARMDYKIRPGGSSSSEGGMAVFARGAREALKVARDMLERGMDHVVVTDENGQPCDLSDLALVAETEGTTDPTASVRV
jgi:hypothetical protein